MATDARSFTGLFADHPNPVDITGDCLREECRSLLEDWAGRFSNAG
jgi:hypothetical protein